MVDTKSSKWQVYVIRLDKDCALAEWALGGIRRSYDSPEYMEQFLDVAIRKLQDAKRDLQYFKNVSPPPIPQGPPRPPVLPG
jgi:hypothetical protein